MRKGKRKILKKLKYSPAAIGFILPEKFLLIGNFWMGKVQKAKETGRRWSKGLIRDVLQEISEQGIDGVKVSADELEKTMWALLTGEVKSPRSRRYASLRGKEKEKIKNEKLIELIYKIGEENVRRRIGQGSDLRIAGKWPSLSDSSTKFVRGQFHKNPFLAASFNRRSISFIVIDHTRTDRMRGQVFIDETRRQIEEYHAVTLHHLQEGSEGWDGRILKNRADIDYHYLIDSAGNILAGRSDEYPAWFLGDFGLDCASITIGILGDLRRAKIAQKQFQSLISLCKTLIDLYKIEKNKEKILLAEDLESCGKNFPQEEFYRELGV